MLKIKLNRSGLERLLAKGYTKKDLAVFFRISRPWLDALLDGKEMRHPAITAFINAQVEKILNSKKKV